MSYFHIVEVNGGATDETTQVSIILTTLPKSFDQFKSNYGMNKLKFNLTQLLSTFQSMFKDNKVYWKVKFKPLKKQVQKKKQSTTTDKAK
ncbi:hypothetical protein ACOSQ4_027142 [Xanthoceras sorbifolium]